MFNFAISYYIYEIATPTIAGIYLATGGLVYFVLSPFGGAIVDRLDKVKVVWMTDYIRGIAVVIAGLVIFSGVSLTITLIVLFAIPVLILARTIYKVIQFFITPQTEYLYTVIQDTTGNTVESVVAKPKNPTEQKG